MCILRTLKPASPDVEPLRQTQPKHRRERHRQRRQALGRDYIKKRAASVTYIYVGELNEDNAPVGNIKEKAIIAGLQRHFPGCVTVVSNGTPAIKSGYYYVLKAMLTVPWLLIFHVFRARLEGRQPILISNAPFLTTMLPAALIHIALRVPLVSSLDQGPVIPELPMWINHLDVWLFRQSDAILTYVAQSALDFAPGKPYHEMLYAVNDAAMRSYNSPQSTTPPNGDTFTICYTGSISLVYNIDLICEVIRVTGKRYRWVFAGQGKADLVARLREFASDQSYDVTFLGPVDHDSAIVQQLRANLLLCLRGGVSKRPALFSQRDNYAASGKLVEYLCSGVPVLAGDIPAFQESVKRYTTRVGTQTPSAITHAIESIVATYPEKLALAAAGREFAQTHATTEIQNSQISQFLRRFAANSIKSK